MEAYILFARRLFHVCESLLLLHNERSKQCTIFLPVRYLLSNSLMYLLHHSHLRSVRDSSRGDGYLVENCKIVSWKLSLICTTSETEERETFFNEINMSSHNIKCWIVLTVYLLESKSINDHPEVVEERQWYYHRPVVGKSPGRVEHEGEVRTWRPGAPVLRAVVGAVRPCVAMLAGSVAPETWGGRWK